MNMPNPASLSHSSLSGLLRSRKSSPWSLVVCPCDIKQTSRVADNSMNFLIGYFFSLSYCPGSSLLILPIPPPAAFEFAHIPDHYIHSSSPLDPLPGQIVLFPQAHSN